MKLTDSTHSPALPWLAVLALAVFVHVFGLGGQYIPTNGDEMVYAHIARETAQTGHWLPLASELADTRNTKPPLLFWQAIAAGNWGQRWNLFVLRAPSVIYSLLVAAAVGWTVQLIRKNPRDALIAACVYLSFFSTYRYGRAYLTSAPESFWFSLPLFALLWRKLRAPETSPGWLAHALFGLALGLGLAYKSFALIAPAAAAWWLAQVVTENSFNWRARALITLRVGFSAALALGVFSLWFVLDPDPAAVWREFIVGENSAKFSDSQGWWHEALLGGGSSLWAQLLAYAVNAGLLGFVVAGLAWTGWKLRPRPLTLSRWASLSPALRILLAWALVWLVVFLLPSQRSARYVIPAMPAVAMLIALYWREIPARWFLPALPLAGAVLLMLARIAWVGREIDLFTHTEIALALIAALTGAVVTFAGVLHRDWRRICAVLSCLLVYATFEFTVAPLDAAVGQYPAGSATALPTNARIAVPNGFNGQFERYQFLLPGGYRFVPYDTESRVKPSAPEISADQQLAQLLRDHDAVVWTAPGSLDSTPACRPDCIELGQRWQFKSRHQSGEITAANLWTPQVWLFKREWLLSRASAR